jgi:hypothetical protein
MPVVLLDAPGGHYWRDFLEFVRRNLLDEGMISPDDMSLLLLTDSVEATVADVVSFYRVFHSMVYVSDRLMLRLRKAPSEKQLATINREFADILTNGQFALRDAPPGEPDDAEFATLTRLQFHFNRRNHGRLRKLVDWLNAEMR